MLREMWKGRRLLRVVVDDLLESVDLVVDVVLDDLIEVDLAAAAAGGENDDRGDDRGEEQDREQDQQVARHGRRMVPGRRAPLNGV